MTSIRSVCILLLFCRFAPSVERIGTEAALPPLVSVFQILIGAGLDPAVASDIQSDLSNKAFSQAEAKLIEQIGSTVQQQALLEVLGGVFFLDSDYLQAAVAYKKAETHGALSESARFTLAMSYIELKRTNWARDELRRLIRDKPQQLLYHYWLGRVDYDEQKFADAIASFRTAIEIDERFVRAYDGKGLCEEAIGDSKSAEQSYQRANILNREQGSHFPWPPLDYGAMLARLGRYNEATLLLNEALTIDSSLAKARYEMGRVEEQMSHPEAAIQDFSVATRLDPTDPSPIYALFRLYTKTGKKQLAAAMMTRFRTLKAQQSSMR